MHEMINFDPLFLMPPYHVEQFPIGSCVCNALGYNGTQFTIVPGRKFGSPVECKILADRLNKTGRCNENK